MNHRRSPSLFMQLCEPDLAAPRVRAPPTPDSFTNFQMRSIACVAEVSTFPIFLINDALSRAIMHADKDRCFRLLYILQCKFHPLSFARETFGIQWICTIFTAGTGRFALTFFL